MNRPHRVGVVTATRAEYGHLRGLLRALHGDDRICLRLLVTGAHLDPAFGNSVAEIEADGLPIARRLPILSEGDGPVAAGRTLARGCEAFAEALAEEDLDLLVLLGDRYELMAPALAATLHQVPLAHIHGGEVTLGALDDGIRHALTKLSHLHFPATPCAATRLVHMGEEPERVHWLGAPGLDELLTEVPLGRAELEADLEMDLTRPTALVTFHPETRDPTPPREQLEPLLRGLASTALQFLCTGAGADPGGRAVNQRLADWAAAEPDRVRFVPSLGRRRYASCLRHVRLVVGNSSSGLIEAPCFGTPVLDVGGRQEGRPRGPRVLSVANREEAIRRALEELLAWPPHEGVVLDHPYLRFPDGSASARIGEVLRRCLDQGLELRKPFHQEAPPEPGAPADPRRDP